MTTATVDLHHNASSFQPWFMAEMMMQIRQNAFYALPIGVAHALLFLPKPLFDGKPIYSMATLKTRLLPT